MASYTDHIIDWDLAVEAARAGRLSEYLYPDEDEEGVDGEEELSLSDFTLDETCDTFHFVGEAYEALRQQLPAEELSMTDPWFFRIFGRAAGAETWYADSPELFQDDCLQASFNPKTIAELASLGSEISFEDLRDSFLATCPPKVLNYLKERSKSSEHPGQAFEGAFLRYIEGWNEFMQELAAGGKGLLLYVG